MARVVDPADAAAGGGHGDMAYGRVEPLSFWSTPTPYVFIGFVVVMGLIAVSLTVLLCSRHKKEEAGRRGAGAEAGIMFVMCMLSPLDREDAMPKVLVDSSGWLGTTLCHSSLAPRCLLALLTPTGRPNHSMTAAARTPAPVPPPPCRLPCKLVTGVFWYQIAAPSLHFNIMVLLVDGPIFLSVVFYGDTNF